MSNKNEKLIKAIQKHKLNADMRGTSVQIWNYDESIIIKINQDSIDDIVKVLNTILELK